jgi:hypothetical protein
LFFSGSGGRSIVSRYSVGCDTRSLFLARMG